MIGDTEPSSAQRVSGVRGLGTIPEQWRVVKLRHLLKRRTERNRPDLPLLSVVREKGVILRDTTSVDDNRNYIPDDLTSYKVVRLGQFAMNKMKAWQGSYGVSGHKGIVSPAYFVFDVTGVNTSFFHIAIRSRAYVPAFNSASDGVRLGQWDLAEARMREIPFLLPPDAMQTAIVRFLDHADRRIRHYIGAKQRLIALLEELRQTLISEAVTGRIDIRTDQPYRTYKPSGVDWLKDVPQHWERRRLKTLLRSVDRRSRTGGETLLSLRRDHGVVVYAEHFSRPPQARSLVGFKLVATGQLVVNRMQANNGLVFCSSFDGLVSPDYSVFETKTPLQMGFLSDLLRTPEYLAHFRRSATGLGTGTAGFLRLYDDRFLDTVVFLPPEDEQTMVLREISNRVATINTLIDMERRALQRIDEYHSCLVAEVITGKVDVRVPVVPTAEGNPLKVEDNQETTRHRDAKPGLHGSGLIAQETRT